MLELRTWSNKMDLTTILSTLLINSIANRKWNGAIIFCSWHELSYNVQLFQPFLFLQSYDIREFRKGRIGTVGVFPQYRVALNSFKYQINRALIKGGERSQGKMSALLVSGLLVRWLFLRYQHNININTKILNFIFLKNILFL